MDRQLLERMVGAGVLLIALIIIAPAILDGRRDNDVTAYPGESNRAGEVRRTHTIRLDRNSDTPPVARPLTQSVTPSSTDGAPPGGTRKTTASQANAASGAAKSTGASGSTKTVPAKTSAKTAPTPATSSRATSTGGAPPAAKPAAINKPVTSSGWSVQLGSFAQQDNARRLAKEVEAGGFNARVVPLKQSQSGRTLYRVRVGPKDSRDEALKLAAALEKAGYKGQVTAP